jgi:hypothetical protein
VKRVRQSSERGAALAITMILVSALLAGGALALYLQLADTRGAQYVTESRASLFCAEAGLTGARDYISTQAAQWPLMLDTETTNDPDGYPVEGDLDGDGVMDWHVEVKDNDDEVAPTGNDPTIDIDARIFMISTCIKYPDTPRSVLELISFSGGGTNYRNQSGQGAGGSNNAN